MSLQDQLRTMVLAEMEQQGVNQAELARRTGIAQANVSLYLTGRRDLSLGVLTTFAIALDRDVEIRLRKEALRVDVQKSPVSEVCVSGGAARGA